MTTLIIGSGLAGVTLAETLRSLSPSEAITLVTSESRGHYARPMLSHGFSRADIEQKIVLKSFESLLAGNIEVLSSTTAESINRDEHSVTCRTPEGLQKLRYQRLILAPGSAAWVPSGFTAMDHLPAVINSLEDLLWLRSLRARWPEPGQPAAWAIIGGGLIGCELAADFAKAGDRVSLFHPLPLLMERQLVAEDSRLLAHTLMQQGVDLHLSTEVTQLRRDSAGVRVTAGSQVFGPFAEAILCTGFRPRIELAQAAGLETGRGIRVDGWLRTQDPNIFALGDAAEMPSGQVFAYIAPIRHQAQWLAHFLAGVESSPWNPPSFQPRAKVHGFTATHPYSM